MLQLLSKSNLTIYLTKYPDNTNLRMTVGTVKILTQYDFSGIIILPGYNENQGNKTSRADRSCYQTVFDRNETIQPI